MYTLTDIARSGLQKLDTIVQNKVFSNQFNTATQQPVAFISGFYTNRSTDTCRKYIQEIHHIYRCTVYGL